jgi:membrane protease YdiL (CAAX protease family)
LGNSAILGAVGCAFVRAGIMAFVLAMALVLFALPAKFRRSPTGSVFLPALICFIGTFITSLPAFLPILRVTNDAHWNWSGEFFDLVFLCIAACCLLASKYVSGTEMGLSLRQKSGTLRAVVRVVLPSLLLTAALVWFMSSPERVTKETLWFQGSLPPLAEELAYRGVILGLLDRIFRGRISIAGVSMGWGALISTLVFGIGHGFGVDSHLTIHITISAMIFPGIIGAFLVWLRYRTGSLFLPIVAHSAVNELNYIVSALM